MHFLIYGFKFYQHNHGSPNDIPNTVSTIYSEHDNLLLIFNNNVQWSLLLDHSNLLYALYLIVQKI